MDLAAPAHRSPRRSPVTHWGSRLSFLLLAVLGSWLATGCGMTLPPVDLPEVEVPTMELTGGSAVATGPIRTPREAIPAIRGFFCWAVNANASGAPWQSLVPADVDPGLAIPADTEAYAGPQFTRSDIYRIDLDHDRREEILSVAEFDGRHLCLGVFRLAGSTLRALDLRHSVYDPQGIRTVEFSDLDHDGRCEIVWQITVPEGSRVERDITTIFTFRDDRLAALLEFDSRYRRWGPGNLGGLEESRALFPDPRGDGRLGLAERTVWTDAEGRALPGLDRLRLVEVAAGDSAWALNRDVVLSPRLDEYIGLVDRYRQAYGPSALAANAAVLANHLRKARARAMSDGQPEVLAVALEAQISHLQEVVKADRHAPPPAADVEQPYSY